jgi:hemin uptake protein HemP
MTAMPILGTAEPQPRMQAQQDTAVARRQPLDSTALLQGARCVEIRHNGEVYRLQATRLGKLILTK